MFCELLTGWNAPADDLIDGLNEDESTFEYMKKKNFAPILFLLALLMFAINAFAGPPNAASFVSVQRTLPITNLLAPSSVALDLSGNIYIADTIQNAVLEYSPLASGQFSSPKIVALVILPTGIAIDANGVVYVSSGATQQVYAVVPNGNGFNNPVSIATLTNPQGLAVDAYGNVYVADPGAQFVYKLSPNGSGGYNQSTLGAGWLYPVDVAVDVFGDLYVADQQQPYIVEEQLNSDVYTQIELGNGDFGAPTGVAVDSVGNVYVSDNLNLVEYKLQPSGGGPYVESTIAIYLLNPMGGAVDAQGNLYIADQLQQAIIEVSNNFGSVAVGAANSGNNQVEANFIFDENITLGGVVVKSQGKNDGDFFNAGGLGSGVCTAGKSYLYSDICYVNLGFRPQAPGVRTGSVALMDSFGNLISTAGQVSGFGLSPRAGLLPGNWNRIAGGVAQTNFATGITLDGNGSIYTVASNDVFQTKDGGTTWTEAFDGSAHAATGAVADGGGNIFVSTVDGYIFECVPQPGGSFTQTEVVYVGDSIQGIAIDNNGNLYVTNYYQQNLEEAIFVNGSYVLVTLADFAAIDPDADPTGVAVNGLGQIFVADYYLGVVYGVAMLPNGNVTLYEAVRGLDSPIGLFAGPNATQNQSDLYITDTGRDTGAPTLYQAQVTNIITANYPGYLSGYYTTQYSLFPMVSTIASYPLTGLAMDGAGNFYVSDDEALGSIYQINLASGSSLSYVTTPLGVVSTDSPKTVFLANTGNEALSIWAPGSGQNPSISSNFLLGSGGTEFYPGYITAISDCGIVYPGGSAAQLAADSECALPISFEPQVAGPISGQVVIADNSLDTGAHHVITLNGYGQVAATVTSLRSSLNPANYGQQVTFTAEVNQTSGTQVPVGTLQFYMNGTLLDAPQTLVDGVATYTSNTLPAGNLAIQAVYTPTNGNFSTSTSGTLTEVVNLDAPTLTLSSSLNPANFGQQVTFNFSAVQASGTILPTGTVQFEVNGSPLGTPMTLDNGLATYSTNLLNAGTLTITAVFTSATPDFASGTATLTQVVKIDTPTITLTSSLNPSIYGQSVTFNVLVAQTSGTVVPPGSVQILLNGNVLGAPTLLVDGNATLTTSALSAGTYTISAIYTSTSTNFVSGTATLTQVVNKVTPVVSINLSANPVFVTTPVTVVAVVTGNATNTGTVTIYDGRSVLWTGAPGVNGVSLDLPNLTVGGHSFVATYSGNANVSAGNSITVVEDVEDFTLAVATAPTKPVLSGQTATYTFTVTPVGPLTTLPADINFTATGAPPQSTITITPSPVMAGSGTTTVTMTVKVSPAQVLNHPETRPGMKLPATIALALLLLPFAVKLRRAGRMLGRLAIVAILSVMGLTTMVGLSGCGENFIPMFDLTLTANSGSLNHSVGVTLQVQ